MAWVFPSLYVVLNFSIMLTRFYSDGKTLAVGATGQPYVLPTGRYIFDSNSGSIFRYDGLGAGLNGFWSSIGSGFKKIGSWIGNNFGTIATAGLTIYGINQAGNLQQQQAQAAANAAAQQAAQAQNVGDAGGGLDIQSLLPYALLGLAAYLVLRPS